MGRRCDLHAPTPQLSGKSPPFAQQRLLGLATARLVSIPFTVAPVICVDRVTGRPSSSLQTMAPTAASCIVASIGGRTGGAETTGSGAFGDRLEAIRRYRPYWKNSASSPASPASRA
jgi:hypothetical protein